MGINPEGLDTHAGRRSVVIALYADAGVELADVARHVGHASQATTAKYVTGLGRRSEQSALKAAALRDPEAARSAK